MHLMYSLGADGKRVYTLKKVDESGTVTKSAHPGKLNTLIKRERE